VHELLRRSAAHVVVVDLDNPEFDAETRHHLERVLRLRSGTDITMTDGRGRWRSGRTGVEVTPTSDVFSEPRLMPAITIACALTKGDKPELTVQKLTEIGVDTIMWFESDRSVVQWDARKHLAVAERLGRIARSAVEQSRRCYLPTIEIGVRFDDLVARSDAALGETTGRALSLDRACVLVGPEGGWSERERATDTPLVALGDHVLRAETAAIVAGALLVNARRDKAPV
jgi:16S rRNA (uracil1498-N3)-methyltransferase